MTNGTVADKIIKLNEIFGETPSYLALERLFREMHEQRYAELKAGVINEARGIALIGASGSGKTTAVQELLRPFSASPALNREVLSFPVPSPASLKFVGQTGLRAIGYPLRQDRTSQIVWDMFRDHLRAHKTIFLHLDEAQDLSLNQTPRETQSVINTLKSLMQNQEWPVGLILSGMPALKDMLNHDPQLARRFSPIMFPSLNAMRDTDQVLSTVDHYADVAQITTASELFIDSFAARLIHAADGEYGLLIEYTIAAIGNNLRLGGGELGIVNFKNAFAQKTGCMDGMNPFVVDDFERIECRKLLGGGE
ncbi:ATP-binding protein [Sulfitobacter sp.]|uniref:ATP-binding protein n=1 Tax=Sulfitobacter sp. TaxID=1903071 RepID=UPI003EF23CA8